MAAGVCVGKGGLIRAGVAVGGIGVAGTGLTVGETGAAVDAAGPQGDQDD